MPRAAQACAPLTHAAWPPAALQPKGGAFTGDEKEFFRFVLGSNTVIPAFEEAVAGMKVGLRGGRPAGRRGAANTRGRCAHTHFAASGLHGGHGCGRFPPAPRC